MQPTRQSAQPRARMSPVPAPLKGMQTAAPVEQIEPGYAQWIENFVCRTTGLRTRSGYTVVTSGLGAPVTSLIERNGTVFGCTASSIFSGSTAVATASSGDWNGAVLSNPGGQLLVAANGTSGGYRVYNGTSWSTPTVAGLSVSKIVGLAVHHNRVFFVERDTLTLWYLPLFAIGGQAKPVYLSHLCRKGGSVAAIAVLSEDGGRNANDKLCVVTTAGEVVIWAGSDPDNSVSWSMSGVYAAPLPIGRKCLTSHAGGLAYLSQLGLLLLPDDLQKPDESRRLGGLSDAIWPTLSAAITNGSWSLCSSIEDEILIVSGPDKQFVLSGTGGWSVFTGLGATSWLSAGGSLYFGTSGGRVCRYGGSTDNGQPVQGYFVDRFETYGSRARKKVQRIRPLFNSVQHYRPRIELLADYKALPTSFAVTDTMAAGAASSQVGRWRGVRGNGVAFALMVGVKTSAALHWEGADIMIEPGGSI